jgi:Yip1 domain
MSDTAVVIGSAGEPGLSQVERVVDTYIAPSKTFTDILRSTSWWLPFLLMVLFSTTSAYVVGKQVGWNQVAENQLRHSPNAEDRLSQLTPEARASQMALTTKITMYSTYLVPVILLVILGIYALLVWAGFNFGLGARTTFGQVWAVTWYASLPYLLTSLVGILTLLFGANIDSYDIRNPVGTNLAYYMPDASPMLRAALTQVDLIHLWSVVLTILGMSIVAKKPMGASAVIVVLLWFVGVGLAMLGAFFS